MAAAMLRSLVHPDIGVASAGLVSDGIPCPAGAVEAMRGIGLDLSEHRSRTISAEIVGDAELIVVMERRHLVEMFTAFPGAWRRAFTFVDLLRRADRFGGRHRPESISQWASRLSAERKPSETLSLPITEDIADPMGGSRGDFVRCRDRLAPVVRQLALLLDSV
jgi:protein-tyrosine phosphatase